MKASIMVFFGFFVDYCFLIFLGLQFFGISCRIITNYFLPTIPTILYYPFSKQSTSFLVISMKNLHLICLIQICDFSPTENLRWRPSMLKLFSNNLVLCNYQLWTNGWLFNKQLITASLLMKTIFLTCK